MKVKEIRELINFISKSDLDEVNIETDEFKISIKRSTTGEVLVPQQLQQQAVIQQQPIAQQLSVAPQQPTTPSPEVVETVAPASTEENNFVTIKSPMIGTFYTSSNPETPNFVEIGDTVSIGQPVCIIEAMKLFNEIESEVSGKIVKVLVDNASPVEYDQPLFLVDPS